MKILIACEHSGRVRDAFIKRGHDAISCDLMPTLIPGPHIQGDVRQLLRQRWDMVIAFPPCTYLCLSGVRWLKEQPGRRELMEDAACLFNECLGANADRVAVENPTMIKAAGIRPNDQVVQPWHFGHHYSKRTCLWLKGLPHLEHLPPEKMGSPSSSWERERWLFRLRPRLRSQVRSFTPAGLAEAMANQWG